MHWMFGESTYLFVILLLRYFSFAFFLFIPFATQLFSTLVTSSNLRNQAPLVTELRLLQATFKRATVTVKVRFGVLLRLLRFYQAYCTIVVCYSTYCYVTGGVLIIFQIPRSTETGVSTV